MKRYSIHAETIDGTLQDAAAWTATKAAALRIIRALAKMTAIDTARYVVCDVDGQTVATRDVEAR